MHILHIPSWYPANELDFTGSFFRDQALALHSHAVQIGVVAPMVAPFRVWRLGELRRIYSCRHFSFDSGVPTYRLKSINCFAGNAALRNSWLRGTFTRAFEEYAHKFGWPDLLHVQSMLPAGELARFIKHMYGIPYIVTEHSTAYGRNMLTPMALRRAQKVAQDASLRLAVSRPLCATLGETFATQSLNWLCVPNMLPPQFEFSKIFKKQEQMPQDATFTFLSVGTLNRKKRFDLTLHAFAANYRGDASIVLRICGAGPEYPRLKRLAAALQIAGQVVFVGAISREAIAGEFERASAFVLTSDHETFGVVVIEATAFGLPVIATASGGPEDIVTTTNGKLVERGSPIAIAMAMEDVRRQLCRFDPEQIRADCIAKYGRKSFVTTMTRLYGVALRGAEES